MEAHDYNSLILGLVFLNPFDVNESGGSFLSSISPSDSILLSYLERTFSTQTQGLVIDSSISNGQLFFGDSAGARGILSSTHHTERVAGGALCIA